MPAPTPFFGKKTAPLVDASIDLDLSPYRSELRLREHERGREIFDPVRQKYVALTPEELLRQLLLLHFLHAKKYPRGRMRSEMGVRVNGQLQRCDIAVYDAERHPWLIVECKAPNVRIDYAVFEQASRYNMTLRAPYLAVSNGLQTYCARLDPDTGHFAFLADFPD